jgi:hypothetical protein
MTKIAGSGSESGSISQQMHGSADLDPHQKMSWIRNTAFQFRSQSGDPRSSGAPDSGCQRRGHRLTALSQRRDGGRMPRSNMGLEIIGARSDIVASLTGILDGLVAERTRNWCKITESKFLSKKFFFGY